MDYGTIQNMTIATDYRILIVTRQSTNMNKTSSFKMDYMTNVTVTYPQWTILKVSSTLKPFQT